MISIGDYLLNPAHIVAIKIDGQAALKIHVSNPVGEIYHRCDSPSDLLSMVEFLEEAVNKASGFNG